MGVGGPKNQLFVNFYTIENVNGGRYSPHLSNNRGGWNKRGGGAKVAKSINVEAGILQLKPNNCRKVFFSSSNYLPEAF